MVSRIRIVLLFSVVALIVAACAPPEIVSISNNCSVVVIDYIARPGTDGADESDMYGFLVLRAEDDVEVGVAMAPATPDGTAYEVTINLDQTYPDGTEFYMIYIYHMPDATPRDHHTCVLGSDGDEDGDGDGDDGDEEEDEEEDTWIDTWVDDGRLNWFRGFGDRIIFYTVTYNDGQISLHIYNVHGEDQGQFLLQITPDMIRDNPPGPEHILIAETRDIYDVQVAVYRLSTGQLQINYGPDFEGKVFVYVLNNTFGFSAIDEFDTFNVYDILGG